MATSRHNIDQTDQTQNIDKTAVTGTIGRPCLDKPGFRWFPNFHCKSGALSRVIWKNVQYAISQKHFLQKVVNGWFWKVSPIPLGASFIFQQATKILSFPRQSFEITSYFSICSLHSYTSLEKSESKLIVMEDMRKFRWTIIKKNSAFLLDIRWKYIFCHH